MSISAAHRPAGKETAADGQVNAVGWRGRSDGSGLRITDDNACWVWAWAPCMQLGADNGDTSADGDDVLDAAETAGGDGDDLLG